MAFLGKINRIYIVAIVGVVILAMLVAFVMLVFQPKTKLIASTQEERQRKWTEAGGMPAQLIALAQAQAGLEAAKAHFNAEMAKEPQVRTDPIQGMLDLWKEYALNFAPKVLGYLARTGVENSGVSVPGPSTQLWNPVPYLTVAAGGFNIRAHSFKQILEFFGKLNKCPRRPVITGGVQIQGTTPELSASFPLVFYIITDAARPAEAAVAAPPPTAAAPKPGALSGVTFLGR